MRLSLLLALAVVLAACREPVEVQSFGSLRAMMHEGKTGPAVVLAAIAPGPHAYALGALAGLRGEVTVVDDVIWVSVPGEKRPRTVRARRSAESAALLVTARVARWRDVPLPRDIGPDEIDREIAALATANGVATARPFPFLVVGPFAEVRWHVIDGRRVKPGGSHADHAQNAQRGMVLRTRGTIVGFYSERHEGVFTHHGERTHLHVVLPAEDVTGHVDRVTLSRGAVLRLPL